MMSVFTRVVFFFLFFLCFCSLLISSCFSSHRCVGVEFCYLAMSCSCLLFLLYFEGSPLLGLFDFSLVFDYPYWLRVALVNLTFRAHLSPHVSLSQSIVYGCILPYAPFHVFQCFFWLWIFFHVFVSLDLRLKQVSSQTHFSTIFKVCSFCEKLRGKKVPCLKPALV